MSGGMPAARILDPTDHQSPAAPGIGSSDVLIGNRPAWRTMVDTHVCPATTPNVHGPEKIYMGSTTVLINNQMACRMADILQGVGPPNGVAFGDPTVVIGDEGFGMAREEVKEAFAATGCKLLAEWDDLKPSARLKQLQKALNSSLPKGMPPLRVRSKTLPHGTNGLFRFRKWLVALSPDIFDDFMDARMMGRLINTTYHEGRHGEQWWTVAQHMAAKGHSAADIQTRMGIPRAAAQAAVRHPAKGGTSEGVMGNAVLTSVYGDRAAYRNDIFDRISTDPDAYYKYRALPEEEDAWRHGDDMEGVFRATRAALARPSARGTATPESGEDT